MNPVRKALAAAALIGPLLLATGCGIATTGVVESGRAGTVGLTTEPDPELMYFISPGGGLIPVLPSGPANRARGNALMALLLGPNDTAREAGLTTQLPPPDAKTLGKTQLIIGDDGRSLRINLPFPIKPLSALARRQLACTAVSAVRISPAPTILLIDPERQQEQVSCTPAEG
ncbi:hypothetical protein OG389_30080 [Streptomyces sp. NBC_00435]|uniref:hypothetical protein n=1 Tax=Streptomyces sp. NBC_00435 TaxID=2903649 RepID=UPI002E206E6D